ncbi:unnamed protein product [Sphagnum troendelagicum]
MEEEQEACISVSGATTTRRYNNRSSSREITDPVLEIGGLGFLKTNSLGEGERENIYSVESVTSGGSKNHTLTTEDASVEQLTGNKSVLSGCFKEGSPSCSILGTTKEVNEVEDRQTGCMEKELCILVPSVEFQLKLKRMAVENNVENWVPKASTEDGDLVALEITEMAEIDCAEVAQTVDSVAIEYGNTKDSGKTKDCSGFDKGSSITDQEDGVGPTHGGGRDRGQMTEGETVTDDLTTAVRQQLRRRAKKKGEADTSPPGEGESLCNKGKGDGNSKILGTSTQVLEEDFESGVAEAMAVVMKVHGVLEPAADPAASFPGMVGLDTKRECHCCQKPESLRNTIVCDNCESSFHLHCVDLQRKQVAELENWHCLACGLAVGVGCWPLGNTKSGLVRNLADSKISNESDGTRFTENRQLATCCQEAVVHGSEGSIGTSVNLKAREAHNIAVPSYFLKEDSGKDAELKEKEDTLQMLRSFVAEKHGELGNGWDVVIRRRQGNDRVCDKYFVSPDKQRFRSRLEVVRYLGLVGGKGGPKKRNACVGSHERALVNNSEQTVTKGVSCSTLSVVSKVSSLTCCCVFQLKSQIGHGDLPLERLGAMKSCSGELDGPQTLPSGYKSTWHDSETGSLCMCEVVGGEQSSLVFRVTRKSFFPVAELDGVAVVCADSAKHACDNGFDLVDNSREKDHTRSGRSELSSFVTQKSIDEVQHLQSNIQTRSDPIQRAEALQDMTAPEVIPVGFKPWPLDEIGEFIVEAASPSDAWKLFVQEFMTRIRRSHTATKSLCSHVASRIGQKQDAEVSGNASLVFDHELGNCQIPGGADVEMAECSDENKIHGETGMAVHKGMGKNLLEEVLFKRLEARLAKSQFEINQPVVQEVTQVLQGVGNDNIDKQVNKTLEGISGEILQENVQSELTNSANQEVFLRSYERSPPPTGQPLGKKLPTELVGDLLEAWEFLHRFSELIGQESLPTFEDLEAGLSDMGLDMEGKRGDDSDVMTADGSVRATAEKCTAEANVGETAQVHGKELGRGDGAMMPLDSELDHNVVTVAHAHIPLLKFLLADMQYRVLGDPTGGRCEEPKKRGRPLLNEPVPVIPEFGGDLPVNEVTWPELAHRYLVTLIEVKKSGDPSGLRPEERRRLIRCLQGDGGVLFGAAATVVAVESDAQVLAEAEMELSLLLPNAEKKDKQEALADDENNGHYPSDEIPPWVKALEPVRTMPTNVGARIRAKVREALDLHPVKWAADILEWSISRDIFKGNASGPTKRAVVQVLAKFYGGSPAKAQRRKTRKPVASPDYLMQCCRIVLRHVADADKGEVFSILIGGPEGHGTGKVRGMVARPLDFRTIDARLASGAYGGLPEAFAADVRQIWSNVEEVHGSGSDMVELANSLSQLFESLYQKQVLSLIEGDVDTKDKSRNSYGDADHMDKKFLEKDAGNGVEIPEKPGKLLKAPWEDDDTCRVCGVDEDYERIMLCDGCEAEYHTYCLDPPLQKVPEGNWFCPSCVSVKRGFPEATAVVGGEETGVKNAVNGLEGEDGHVPAYGFLDDTLESEGELPRVQTPFVESPAHTLLERIGATDYCHWSLADRVQFLKILCDNALETPQIRAHLEKSLDTASELRTQLRVLSVKRDQALEAEQCQNVHHSRLPNEQIQITSTTPGQGAQAMVKLGMATQLHDGNEENSEEAERRGIFSQVGSVEDKNSEWLLKQNVADVTLESIRFSKMQNGVDGKQLTSSHGTSALGAVIDGPSDAVMMEMAPPLLDDRKDLCHEVGPDSGDLKVGRSEHIGEDPTPTNLNKLQPSLLLENNADSAEKLQDSLRKLDAEIGQVETKLWNMNVRRDHLGTDDLGREYWAFCGSDNQPFLVVAEEAFVIEATGVSTSGRMDGGTVESRKMKFKVGCLEDGKFACPTNFFLHLKWNRTGRKWVCELSPWWVYKGEEALDNLVSWLISESKGERSLKVSIHEWRRSVFTKHQHPDEELNEVKLPLSCSISGKEGDKSVHPVMMTTRKPSRISADIFPRVKATVILEARYGSSGESSSSIKQLNRCECLEPLWRTRSHCQSCHETYESSVELLNHQKTCPIVQSPGTDFQEVETQPLSNKRKWRNSSSGMVINSASSERKTESRPGSSKCTRLSGDNEILKRPHSAERLCMIEEASVFSSRPATRILANETGDDFGLFPPEAITLLDYKWDYLVNVPPTTCQVNERLDGDIEGYYPSSYANVDNVVLREDSVPSSTAPLGEVQSEGFKQDTSEQGCGPETAMPVGVTGKKPAKKFPVLEAATCPLVGEQKVILRGLQLRLLDIEAAMTKDMLEPARSSPVRRRAWRFLVKSMTCIYQMTKAIILLEQMVKVEFLKKTWCQWSSLSAAARSVTVSSLALKLYALDASITYRIKGKSDQEKQHPTTSGRKGKKKRHLHVKTK